MTAFIPPAHWLREPGAHLVDARAEAVPREFVRVSSGSGTIANLAAAGRGDCTPPHLPTGVKFQGDACDYDVRLATMSRFRMAYEPGRYANGDGFATELGNARILFDTCKSLDNADAGFDLKGPDWRMHNCLASGNAHNVRLWSRGHASGKLISQNPKLPDPRVKGDPLHLHICIAREWTERQDIVIDFLHARGPGTLLRVETVGHAIPPRIVIGAHDIKGVTRLVHISGPAPEIVWTGGEPKAP